MAFSFATGYEHGVSPISSNGSGLSSSVVGTPTLVTSPVKSGIYSLRIATDGVTAQYVRHRFNGAATPSIGVFRFYLRISNWQNNSAYGLGLFSTVTAASTEGIDISNSGVLSVRLTGGSLVTGPTLSLNQWYMIEGKLNLSGATWTFDWKIDGVDQPQATSVGTSPDTISYIRLGSSTGTGFNNGVFFFDDLVLATSSDDFPIGEGGTEILKPTSDGSHDAGTNVIEDNTNTDIGVTSAYNKIDSIPMNVATTYIRQAVVGTANYAEVQFGNIVASHSAILGAVGILAYTSDTTSSNNGGCIMSKDDFATDSIIWGKAGALSDYSDGSTSNLYYKSAMIAGVVDDATVNALEARIGYSGDATPDPLWVNLAVEVAYKISNNEILLDLVTYSSTIPAITVTENEIINLDLVTFSSAIPAITFLESALTTLDLVIFSSTIASIVVTENEIINLDLVTYSSTIPAIIFVENINSILDLVTFSSTIPAITFLESALTVLDLVPFSSTIPSIVVTENEIIPLDLVTYNSSILAITFLESALTELDLVTYSSTIPAITVTENEIINLDLVTYSSTIPAITVTENEIINLDLVTYNSTIHPVTVLESFPIPLDLVTYSSTIPAITVTENEIINLDLVTFSSAIPAIIVTEQMPIPLDLVTFSSIINPITTSENISISLDLASFSSTIYPIIVTEASIINLDLVIFTSTIRNIDILEESTIGLDLVTYNSQIGDISVLENIVINLDLVTFTNTYGDLTIIADDLTLLNLVVFNYSVQNLLFLGGYELLITPIERCYMIEDEPRYIAIESEDRTILTHYKEI